MGESDWSLRESPFRNHIDPQFRHRSPSQEEALARLRFLVDYKRRMGLLMGPRGSGKSLLLAAMADELRREGLPVAKLSLLGLEPTELLWQLSSSFGLNPDRDLDLPTLWGMVFDRLAEYGYQRLGTVVLMDDADRAKEEVITSVARLAEHDGTPDSALTIVLAGRRERMGRLGRSLLELADLRIDLQPWEKSDTERYVNGSVADMGWQTPGFTDEAVARLHELAQGMPRQINQLADLTVIAAAGQSLPEIAPQTVESVYHELGVLQV